MVEHLTNDIDVITVGGDGTLSPIVVNPSAGPGALSVSFAPNGVALVSETGPSGVPNGDLILCGRCQWHTVPRPAPVSRP